MGTDKTKQLTLLSQLTIAFTARNTIISMNNRRSPYKILKNHPRPFFRPRSIHICQLKPNPSGDPVPAI